MVLPDTVAGNGALEPWVDGPSDDRNARIRYRSDGDSHIVSLGGK